MRAKTAELTGAALDWAVTKCEGVADSEFVRTHMDAWPYSTDWAFGGPIIEREKLSVDYSVDRWFSGQAGTMLMREGPAPLIAAMRCFVSSRLGDEVEVPDELI